MLEDARGCCGILEDALGFSGSFWVFDNGESCT